MKKLIALTLIMMLSFPLAACGSADPSDNKKNENTDNATGDSSDAASGGETTDTSEDDEKNTSSDKDEVSSDSDLAYIKEKGTLVVGVTNFEPMDYIDDKGEWVGFDADMANAFAKSLGVTAEFVEIDWDSKIMELDGKTIDCVWNGMTLTDEVINSMECSDAYCNNAQIVIVPADKAEKYQNVDSLSDLTFAVETGSAGEEQANELDLPILQSKIKQMH